MSLFFEKTERLNYQREHTCADLTLFIYFLKVDAATAYFFGGITVKAPEKVTVLQSKREFN